MVTKSGLTNEGTLETSQKIEENEPSKTEVRTEGFQSESILAVQTTNALGAIDKLRIDSNKKDLEESGLTNEGTLETSQKIEENEPSKTEVRTEGFSMSSDSTAQTSSSDIDKLRAHSDKEIKKVFNIMIGVVLFVVITFLIEIYGMNLDRIKDKDIYLRYNENYQQYSEKNLEMMKALYDDRLEANNLKNELSKIKWCISNFGFTEKCFE